MAEISTGKLISEEKCIREPSSAKGWLCTGDSAFEASSKVLSDFPLSWEVSVAWPLSRSQYLSLSLSVTHSPTTINVTDIPHFFFLCIFLFLFKNKSRKFTLKRQFTNKNYFSPFSRNFESSFLLSV